jgi:hypothetical protein
MRIAPDLPVNEYLNSSYSPDMEYVDGVLVERGEPTLAHGLLQVILCANFRMFLKQFRFAWWRMSGRRLSDALGIASRT